MAEKDFYYCEILNMMRVQGAKDNPTTLQLGVMQSEDSVKVNDLVLKAEDLYCADYLLKGYTRELEKPYIYDLPSLKEPNITYKTGLKSGDIVAVQQLHNTNKFVILAKVVSL
jgi:hypothetical protein